MHAGHGLQMLKKGNVLENGREVEKEPHEPKPGFKCGKWLRNLAIIAALAGILLLIYDKNADFKSNINTVVDILRHGDLQGLKTYLRSFGPWAAVISFLLMMFHMVLVPFPSVVITLTNGYLFGVFWGTLLSWSGSMAGAVLCFYIARLAGRPAVERFIGNKAINAAENFFKRYGNNSVLIARLIPAISFDAVSYVAGITSISLWGFFWASAIGELPATIVYSWLGQNMSATAKFIFWAFGGVAAMLVLGFTIKKAFDRRMANKLKKDAKIGENVDGDSTSGD
jgi:uncharacterized membrane protein YdjX (TVP38/TMEM64 family)